MGKLQETRRKEISNLIEKYKKLVDGIFKEVAKDFPTFKDIDFSNEDIEKTRTITAEEQLYNFMLMREKAIDHADRMLNKINLLELELNDPDSFTEIMTKKDENTVEEEKKPRRSWSKKMAGEKRVS